MNKLMSVIQYSSEMTVNLPSALGVPVKMSTGAIANWLDHRLHLQHGPIDLLITAEGSIEDVSHAFARAANAFEFVLCNLVDELSLLRTSASILMTTESMKSNLVSPLKGVVAKRMCQAVKPYLEYYNGNNYVTPMAAVAGCVADYIIAEMGSGLDRVCVNNGGDIALYLGPGTHFDIGISDDRNVRFTDFSQAQKGKRIGELPIDGRIRLHHSDQIGGVATSGWRGRSQSFGVADSVTVLATDAASADVAATLISNEVSVLSPVILRKPANKIFTDSDLGDRLVTVKVGKLKRSEIDEALTRGASLANQMICEGNIVAVYGRLQGYGFLEL
jgi:ApbE superfamily uncharacterized protein (UPF0280 family)